MLASCSKDSEQLNSSVTKKLTRMNYEGGDYVDVKYQPDGKVSQVITKMSSNLYTKTFTHTPGMVSYLLTLEGKKNEIGDFTIVNGKVTEFTWTYYDAYESPIKTFHEFFEYNAKGLLSKHTYDNGDYNTFSYSAEGDLIERKYHENGIATALFIYTYGSAENKFPWFSEDDNSGHGFFFPAESKHLRTGIKKINVPNGTLAYEYKITHETDGDGYATKSLFNNLMGGGAYSVTYDYQAE
jgi:hypothetical protein